MKKEIEDKAISKAKKSGDIVDRPIKDVGITSKKNNILMIYSIPFSMFCEEQR